MRTSDVLKLHVSPYIFMRATHNTGCWFHSVDPSLRQNEMKQDAGAAAMARIMRARWKNGGSLL